MAGCADYTSDLWVECSTDNTDGVYYWHPNSGKKQNDPPDLHPDATLEQPPVMWVECKDPESGQNYFWKKGTEVTAWSLPKLGSEQAAPPAPEACASQRQSSEPVDDEQEDIGNTADAWVAVEPGGGFWNYRLLVTARKLPVGLQATWSAWRDPDDGQWFYVYNGGNTSLASRCDLRPGSAVWEIPDRIEKTPTQELSDAAQQWWLEQGAAVAVTGLQRDKCYNGVLGTIVDCDSSKYFVQLPDILGGPVLGLSPKNITKLPVQSIVEFVGLSQEHLNGDIGTVVDVDELKNRYLVKTREETVKAIRPTKLKGRSRLWEIDMTISVTQLQWRQEQRCLFIDKVGLHRWYDLHLPIHFKQQSIEEVDGRQIPKSWPLLVYLHGHGGWSFFKYSRKAIRSVGYQFAAERFVVVSPVCEWGWRESPSGWVIELLEALAAADWIDPRRIYLTGCSMGGMGAWEVAPMAPELFAAVAPVAAHHKPEKEAYIAHHLQGVPIFVIHSDSDETCLMSKEEPLWRLFEGRPTFHKKIIQGVDHCSIQEEAYCNNISLYTSLLDRTKL